MIKKWIAFKKTILKLYESIKEIDQIPFNGLLPVEVPKQQKKIPRTNQVSVEDLRPQDSI